MTAAARTLRQMRYTSRPRTDAIAWQQEVRSRLLHILKLQNLISMSSGIGLDPSMISCSGDGGYQLREFEISSTVDRRMRLVIGAVLENRGPCPAVVCIHGHNGHKRLVYDRTSIYRGFAQALTERGFVTISTDVGQHQVYEQDRTLMGERLWDLMRCIDYLESVPDVDTSRIGCAGLSLGGEMAMWLGAMDQRVTATVSSGFLTRMDQMEQNHCRCWDVPGLRELVDFADLYSLVAPRPLLCQNGLQEDPIGFPVSIAAEELEDVRGIYADLGQPQQVALVAHNGGHVIDLASLLAFFEKEFLNKIGDMARPSASADADIPCQ